MTPRLGLIGWPLGYSISPALFERALARRGLPWRYETVPVPTAGLANAIRNLRAAGFRGVNVTIPHKEAVIPLLDALTAEARAIGAVNCIIPGEEGLIGHNTDWSGFAAALISESGFDAREKRALVLGAGGAARAVVYALVLAGAASITVIARRAGQSARVARELGGGAGGGNDAAPPRPIVVGLPWPGSGKLAALVDPADLLVNATPLGMAAVGASDAAPLPPGLSEALHPGILVYDLVYRPRPTSLIRAARARGAATVDGLAMLAFQAAEAFRLWTGTEMTNGEMLAIAERVMEEDDGG